MYQGSGYKHSDYVGGQNVSFDSKLEKRVLEWLDNSGFAGRWHKPTLGINVGDSNYTPDIELSVQYQGMTHRAIVEIKPTLAHFNDYISRRMRGVAPHYYTEMLLLYSEKENTWYRIDMITGTLSVFGIPIPGETPIHKLYKPLTLPAQPIYSHRYNKRLEPIKSTLKGATNVVEAVITGPKSLSASDIAAHINKRY